MKTSKTWHLSVFLERLLPFINADSTADGIITGAESALILMERPSFTGSLDYLNGIKRRGQESVEHSHAKKILSRWREDAAIVAHLRKTRDIARRMVRIALVAGEEGDHELWSEIRAARFAHGLTWNVAWVKRGQTFSTWVREESEDLHKALTAFIIAIIADAFQAIGGEEPAAAAWCGVCPRCGKVFEKKRKDHRWCGDSCRGSQGK